MPSILPALFRPRCRLAAGLLLAPLLSHAVPPLPVIPAGTFMVTTYGAVGDGSTDNTTAIQTALNAAKAAGGGTVEIPAAAQPYRCGPITVSSKTNLQVDAGATLQALPFGTYPNSNTSPAHFITIATNATQVALSGGGIIDGNGAAWWTAYNNKSISNRPRLVQINHVDTMQITGVTLQNSPMFHLAFNATNNVTIDHVTITAPASSPNTDGIDPAGVHYLITQCTIAVGDDNIAVKPGSSFCGDITVSRCSFGSGHGVSIGGQTNVGLDGMIVDQCTFNGTTTALRMKADPTQGGPVQNVTYSNLTLTNVPYPFAFYSYYVDVGTPGATSGSNQTTPAKVASWNATPPDSLRSATIPTWKNITLSNITATGATGYSTIWGLPLANALISNVTLDNVQVSGAAGLEVYNAANVQFTGGTTFAVPPGTAPVTTYNALAIVSPPQSETIAPGGAVTFSVTTAGTAGLVTTAPAYQWLYNGNPLADGARPDGTLVSGSATPTLSLRNVQTAAAGGYSVRVSTSLDSYDASTTTLTPANTAVSATSATAQLEVASPPASSLVNLSVRSAAGTGDQTLIVGFVVAGYGKPVLLRAVGPGLGSFGVNGVMADPQLALYRQNWPVATNDNWGTSTSSPAVASLSTSLGAFPLTDNGLDAALVETIDAGSYTAQVTSMAGTGIVLAEIYDGAPRLGAHLVNLSVRGTAGSGDGTLIAGFVVAGSGTKKLLIRGIGPTLASFGVGNALGNPQLSVIRVRDGVTVATNDDWGSSSSSPAIAAAFAQTGAFNLPDGSKDAAVVITLPPEAYTAQVTGAGGATGVALVEVYEVP